MYRALVLAAGVSLLLVACTDSHESTGPRALSAPELLNVPQEPPQLHAMAPLCLFSSGSCIKGGDGPIQYHGGRIIPAIKVATIYWSTKTMYTNGPAPGTSGSGAQDGSLVGFFLRNLGGSPYFNINTTYFDGTGTHVQNSVTYTQFWADGNGPSGTVSDAQVQQEVVRGLTSGALSYDPSTLYAVFSGPGVNLGGGFGTQYCAYHGHFSSSVGDVKYAVMPYDWSAPAG